MGFRRVLMAAVATAGLAVAGVAVAQPWGMHHGGGEGMELLHSLNLTDAQKVQAHKIGKAAFEQAKPVMKQMHAIHEQIATAMLTSGPVTAEQLAPLVQQEEALRNQLDTTHLSTMLQIRSLLTPEQIKQAAATHTKMEALHEQMHEVIGEPGPHGGDE